MGLTLEIRCPKAMIIDAALAAAELGQEVAVLSLFCALCSGED